MQRAGVTLPHRLGPRPRIVLARRLEQIGADIELDREVFGRYSFDDLIDLAPQHFLVCRLDRRMIGGIAEKEKGGILREWKRELKTNALRDRSFVARFAERLIRLNRLFGVAQLVEMQARHAGLQLEAEDVVHAGRLPSMLRLHQRDDRWMAVKGLVSDEDDPPHPYADFAVGQTRDIIAQQRPAGFEHFFG